MTLDKKVKWAFMLVVMANLVIVLMAGLGAFTTAPSKRMPNPNGYDDFVKAGAMLTGKPYDSPTMKQDELATLVATNAEALRLLRVGLSRECRVPDDYSSNYIRRIVPELTSQKELAFSLYAEGRLAKMQGRTNDAAQSYLDAAGFGVQCSQGGVLIAKLVGIACESTGREGLRSLTNNVNSQECRNIARTLEILDAKESAFEDIVKSEGALVRKSVSLQQRLAALFNYRENQKLKAAFLAKFQKNRLERRHLMIDFAARAYQSETGKSPAAIADLVPVYLKAIPKDPVTGTNLVYGANAP